MENPGITNDLHKFVKGINTVLPYYIPYDASKGVFRHAHDFFENDNLPEWLSNEEQFESEYLYLTIETEKDIVVQGPRHQMIRFSKNEELNVENLLFRSITAFNMGTPEKPVGAYEFEGRITLVFPDSVEFDHNYLEDYKKSKGY